MEIIDQMKDTARNLVALSDEGDASCEDDGCHVFFGIVRDCAYRILTEAERESDNIRLRCSNTNNNGCDEKTQTDKEA
jgi:hypothetical protein